MISAIIDAVRTAYAWYPWWWAKAAAHSSAGEGEDHRREQDVHGHLVPTNQRRLDADCVGTRS